MRCNYAGLYEYIITSAAVRRNAKNKGPASGARTEMKAPQKVCQYLEIQRRINRKASPGGRLALCFASRCPNSVIPQNIRSPSLNPVSTILRLADCGVTST